MTELRTCRCGQPLTRPNYGGRCEDCFAVDQGTFVEGAKSLRERVQEGQPQEVRNPRRARPSA